MKNQTDDDNQHAVSGPLMISENVIASEFGGGVSIVNLETNAYFRLEGVAWIIWRELAATPSFDDLCGAIQDMYQISRDVTAQDLQRLLSDLLRNGLIIVVRHR